MTMPISLSFFLSFFFSFSFFLPPSLTYLLIRAYALRRLEGHTCAVSTVKFSNSGDRVLSGSFKEGRVRVWAFRRDFSRYEHFALSMADDDAESEVTCISFSISFS